MALHTLENGMLEELIRHSMVLTTVMDLQAMEVIKQVPVIRQPAPASIQSWESSY